MGKYEINGCTSYVI